MMKFLDSGLEIFYTIAVFQALFMTLFLFLQKKGSMESKLTLSLLLVNFTIFLNGTYLMLKHSNLYYAHMANLTIFLAPPLLYIYYKTFLDKEFTFNRRMLVHFLPFLVLFSFMFYQIFIKADAKFVFKPYGIILMTVLFAQNLFYMMRLYKTDTQNAEVKHDYSKIRWIKNIFLGMSAVYSVKLFAFFLWNIFGLVKICVFFTGLFFLFSFLLINMLVLYSMFNPEILTNYFKYKTSLISKEIKENGFSALLNYIEQKKPFLDSLLTLSKLAKQVNIPSRQLSQLINENTGNNFNDFINKYRIEQAQIIIANSEKVNILNVAYQVGFNSKSTFNSAFRKFTNMTPSEFKKSLTMEVVPA